MERKYSQIKADVTEEGVISGYASRFGVEDQGGDTVVKGAYTKSLEQRSPKMLWQHDPSQPIGVWDAKEDEKGLFVTGQIAIKSTPGRDAYELIKAGAIDGLSIGYQTAKQEKNGNGRFLKELKLYEVSLVTFPMQIEASVDTVKSEHMTALKREIEKIARDAGFPAWQAKKATAAFTAELGEGSRDAAAEEELKAAFLKAFKL